MKSNYAGMSRREALGALGLLALSSRMAWGAEAQAGIISPEFHLVTPEKVTAAHAARLQVVAWTANTPTDWDRLIEAKVDAIISDDPAALIAHLKARGLR